MKMTPTEKALWRSGHFSKVNWDLVDIHINFILAELGDISSEERFIQDSVISAVNRFRIALFRAAGQQLKDSKTIDELKYLFSIMRINLMVGMNLPTNTVRSGMRFRLSAINRLLRDAYVCD